MDDQVKGDQVLLWRSSTDAQEHLTTHKFQINRSIKYIEMKKSIVTVNVNTAPVNNAERSFWREWISDTSLKFSGNIQGRYHKDSDTPGRTVWSLRVLAQTASEAAAAEVSCLCDVSQAPRAVAQHCYNGTSVSYGKMETLTPCKIETLEQIDIVRIDYVHERNVCSKFGKKIRSRGTSGQRGEP